MSEAREYPSNPRYLIYSDGSIYSKYYKKFLIPKKTNDGYLRIQIWSAGKNRYLMIHRIVAETFLPNPNGYEYINHKDGNKANNCVDNLEWCTQSFNAAHGVKNGFRDTKICRIDEFGNKTYYENQTEAEKELGVKENTGGISRAISLGVRYKGYFWEKVSGKQNKRKKVVATNGVETLIFKSQYEAMDYFGVCQSSVVKAIRFGMTVKGFKFRYEDGEFVERETKRFDENESYREHAIKYKTQDGKSLPRYCEENGVDYSLVYGYIKRHPEKTLEECVEHYKNKK
jgi:hypothetical protein